MSLINCVFLGTPDIGIPCLEMLTSLQFVNLSAIITKTPRQKGRGLKGHDTPVALFAKENKITLYEVDNLNKSEETYQAINALNPDCLIVFAFSQFLNSQWLNIAKHGAFNIHTSLLPKYRGASPIQMAILNGDEKTGVCIQKMVKKMDAGDIYLSKEVQIKNYDTSYSLYQTMKFESALLLKEFLYQFSQKNYQITSQNESLITFAPIIKKEDGKIDFINCSTNSIFNKIRAFFPWPGTFFHLDDLVIKVISARKSDLKLGAGEVFKNKKLVIGTMNGAIEITKLQLPGKRPSNSQDFLNGHRGEFKLT